MRTFLDVSFAPFYRALADQEVLTYSGRNVGRTDITDIFKASFGASRYCLLPNNTHTGVECGSLRVSRCRGSFNRNELETANRLD